ncbi:MAG: glycosyl hydrolase family 18 protein [Candidatus Pristimantibacillus lignocellulolyticus]|uniref:Glycosyl hydrolase family 18 protein n=1 Tax=Candidatus Pristimantibacillus lignocellulolyticus TaxID=2994561 RepID=A0A9J6ZD87_9BACL|nr:MAG: glycosyl hydrolase family 18 protein [Candidatus Pristimantibacillus lignocellulolyticus]
MTKKFLSFLAIILFITPLLTIPATVDAASNTTLYRVYQNEKLLKEFPTSQKAIAYAKYYNYSHVEKISNREWVWNNIPKYKVYIDGKSTTKLEYSSLAGATKYSATQLNSYVRDLENVGWAFENYANYQLYQGDKTYSNWSFYSLNDAKKAAAKWTNSHIIDLNSNSWIWDNISEASRKTIKSSTPIYMITVDGEQVAQSKKYSFLKEAITASNKVSNSEVYNTATEKVVHSNIAKYNVYTQGKLSSSFVSLDSAVASAKKLYAAEVKVADSVLWTNISYYTVYQGDKAVKSFHALKSALAYSKSLSNSTVINQDGRKLFTTVKDFLYLGWNGSSTVNTINQHVANTQGLDIDSPTWYFLEDATGKLNDTSNAELVKTMAEQDIDIIPLVHNQFDKTLTTAFLKDVPAQDKFITSLINSLKSINAKGFNLDFESIAATDRNAFTNFVKKLTEAAHKQKLTVSIDLLRGDVLWNHNTAYDQEAIGKIVDYVIIMAYDEHWTGSSEAGSVASLSWVEEGIKQYLNYGIPRNKLILGIPFYVREWRLDSKGNLVDNRSITMKNIAQVIEQNNATGVFDAKTGQYKYTYQLDGYTHVFWAETEQTVISRIKLAKKYELAGIAAWRLGYEDASLWEAILKYKSQ